MADYLFQSALVSDVMFLMVQLLAVLPLYLFFSNVLNPTLSVRKSFAATPFFIALHSGSQRYRPLAL